MGATIPGVTAATLQRFLIDLVRAVAGASSVCVRDGWMAWLASPEEGRMQRLSRCVSLSLAWPLLAALLAAHARLASHCRLDPALSLDLLRLPLAPAAPCSRQPEARQGGGGGAERGGGRHLRCARLRPGGCPLVRCLGCLPGLCLLLFGVYSLHIRKVTCDTDPWLAGLPAVPAAAPAWRAGGLLPALGARLSRRRRAVRTCLACAGAGMGG